MALMNWAIDVPQKLLQSDAILFLNNLELYFKYDSRSKEELIIKES